MKAFTKIATLSTATLLAARLALAGETSQAQTKDLMEAKQRLASWSREGLAT